MKNSNGFSEVWDLLKQVDYFAGTFLFGPPEKPTWKDKLLSLTLVSAGLNITILIFCMMLLSKFTLISIILGLSIGTVTSVVCYVTWTLIKNKTDVVAFVDWCKKLNDVAEKFHPVVRDIASTHLEIVQERLLKYIKLFRACMYVDAFAITVGFALFGLFLPERLYPKFSLPLPLAYPFSGHKTWLTCLVGTIGQYKMCLDFSALISLLSGVFCCIIMHILAFLDIVKATIRLMKDKMVMKLVVEVEPSKMPVTVETLDPETLSDMNEWIKIIVEMISDISQFMSKLSEFLSKPLLLAELGSFGCLFFTGMIFLVIHQQYVVAIGALWFPAFLLLVCYANEKMMDGFSDIQYELYDIPWYAMRPKERKTLMITMECGNIQGGFNAGKFHVLNIERFGTMLNVAYSKCTVLRDLISK